jgi:CDGSH-type Zn-finger protein
MTSAKIGDQATAIRAKITITTRGIRYMPQGYPGGPGAKRLGLVSRLRRRGTSSVVSDDPNENRVPDEELVTITPYRDGPYLIRGAFVVQDQDGNEMPLQRRTIALCRCGKSRMRPFCDGTHKLIGFEAPSMAEQWPSASGQA